jgi:hypothetical protein
MVFIAIDSNIHLFWFFCMKKAVGWVEASETQQSLPDKQGWVSGETHSTQPTFLS